jgi:hypothetical protein
VDYAELTRSVIEELVEWPRHEKIDVQKQRGTLKVRESILEKAEFHEDVGPLASNNLWVVRKRYGFHAIDKPGCIVSNAHKPERSRKIALNSGIQSVDVFGAIVASPFKTEDIYRLLIH